MHIPSFPRAAAATFALTAALLSESHAEQVETRKHEKWGYNAPDWTADIPNLKAPEAGEHPRLVFRKEQLPRLKQRAASAEGKIMVERMQKILGEKFTLWHPAGHAMMYQLTGDRQHAEKAKELCLEIIDAKRRDERDPRYGFANPGDGGPMRAGPAIGAMGLAYDLAYDAWDDVTRQKVALAIQENPFTRSISKKGPIMPSCNHYGAAVGGVGMGLLAIRNDPGVDATKVEEMLAGIVKQARDEISIGYGDRGYYFEGHQCGRISSNTGLIPCIQAYATAAGKDLVSKNENARWLAAKWIYEFALQPGGKYINPQRGMYSRNFPRGRMWSEQGDFAQGFGICPPEFVPALKWVYNNQVEPGEEKTYDILDNPHTAIYALANWPLDVQEKNPEEQPQLFPKVLHDTAAGFIIFRNGWSGEGKDICVSVLLGTHPTHANGRGMAAGGSVYVFGKGLGKGLEWASAGGDRLPGIFHSSYPVHAKFEPDGSGVVSALRYEGIKNFKGSNAGAADWVDATKNPTSLAVDFTGASGAELLVAMAGPQVGWKVGPWINDPSAAKFVDLTGEDGYVAKVTEVKFGGNKGFVMTLQKGQAPQVQQQGDGVTVGKRRLSFDGVKIMLQ